MIDPSLWFVSVQSTGHLNTFETHCQNTSLKDSTDWQGFQMFALQTPGTAGEGGSEQKKLGVRVVSHTNKKMHPLGQLGVSPSLQRAPCQLALPQAHFSNQDLIPCPCLSHCPAPIPTLWSLTIIRYIKMLIPWIRGSENSVQ